MPLHFSHTPLMPLSAWLADALSLRRRRHVAAAMLLRHADFAACVEALPCIRSDVAALLPCALPLSSLPFFASAA